MPRAAEWCAAVHRGVVAVAAADGQLVVRGNHPNGCRRRLVSVDEAPCHIIEYETESWRQLREFGQHARAAPQLLRIFLESVVCCGCLYRTVVVPCSASGPQVNDRLSFEPACHQFAAVPVYTESSVRKSGLY